MQALKMSYFSNKPAPTPGHLLPRPGTNASVLKEPDLKPSLKRKLEPSDSGKMFLCSVLVAGTCCNFGKKYCQNVKDEPP